MSKRSKQQSQYKPGKNFFRFPHEISDHPDHIALTYAARCLLHDMCRMFNGFNNGNISIAMSDMKSKGWNDGTLNRAKNELLKFEWIYETRKGGKFRTCTLYAISFIPLDDVKPKLDIKKPIGFLLRPLKY